MRGRKGGPGAGGAMGGEMLRQLSRMQRKVDGAKKKLKGVEVAHDAADGRVKVTVTCGGRIRSIDIHPSLLESEGLEFTLDLLTATLNAAFEKADGVSQREYDQATGGLKIPGLT